jgi:hypothetical protein
MKISEIVAIVISLLSVFISAISFYYSLLNYRFSKLKYKIISEIMKVKKLNTSKKTFNEYQLIYIKNWVWISNNIYEAIQKIVNSEEIVLLFKYWSFLKRAKFDFKKLYWIDKINACKKNEIINEKNVIGSLSVALYRESAFDKFDFLEQLKECKSNMQVMEQIFKFNFAEFPVYLFVEPVRVGITIFNIVVNNRLEWGKTYRNILQNIHLETHYHRIISELHNDKNNK